VLSWSCLEAMSVGRVVVGSRTPPVEEVIEHGRNGLLFDFFDVRGLSGQVIDVLANPEAHRRLGQAARESVIARYDLRRTCLPEQLALILGT
jgi:glycosyltransferase involved in cell wall biosynthesis